MPKNLILSPVRSRWGHRLKIRWLQVSLAKKVHRLRSNPQPAISPWQKAATQSQAKSVSRIPTLRRRKISTRVSTPRKAILDVREMTAGMIVMTVRARIMDVEAIAAGVGAGGAGAGVIAADASKAVQEEGTFPPRSTLPRRAANIADTIIAAVSNAMTIVDKKPHEVRARRPPISRRARFSFPANRLQNIATRRQLLRRPPLLPNRNPATMQLPAKKLLRAQSATFPLPLQVRLAFLAV